MRIIGMDIHRVFAEAVALEDGETKRLGRIGMTREHLEDFAEHFCRRIMSRGKRPAMRPRLWRFSLRAWQGWPWQIRCRSI